ncbi:MAG: flippase-like domain-containing protein [Myxococcales bacterium]|nr:flippase-like domain-containing protein [Myxococcales bacterium]
MTTLDEARPSRGADLARLAVTVVLLGYILTKVDLGAFAAEVRAVALPWLGLAALAQFVGHLLNAWRTGFLLRKADTHLSFGSVLATNFVGVFFNALLPGAVGGDFMRFVDFARATPTRSIAAATLLVERYLGLFSLLPIAAFALLARPDVLGFHPLILPSFAVAIALFAVTGYLSDLGRLGRATAWARPAGDAVGRVRPIAWLLARLDVAGRFGRVYDAIALFKGLPDALSGTFALSCVSRVVWTYAAYAVGRAVGVEMHWIDYFLIVPLIELIRMLPITQGGVGLREGAFILYMAPYGVPREAALAVSLLSYGIFLANSLVGAVIYGLRRRPAP